MASPKLRVFRGHVLYRTLVLGSAIIRYLPYGAGRTFGRVIGFLAFHVLKKETSLAISHVAKAFPDWPRERHIATIKEMWRHLGRSVFEVMWMPNVDVAMRDRLTEFEGVGRLMEEIDKGRGVVIITAHCGNWEWLATGTGLWGRPTAVLQRGRNEALMNRFITATRARANVRTIDRGSSNSARELIRSIRRGGILAFLIDQNIRTESVKIPFFGEPALTPIGPARLATITEALLVLAFTERLPDGRHKIRYTEPRQITRDDDPIALTQWATEAIEEQIRRVPEQWVWFHERWRERPEWEIAPD